MNFSDIFWLSIVALLSAYLYWKDRQRYKKKLSFVENDRVGHGIDVFDLRNRLQKVRSNFPESLPAVPGATSNRKSLLASARRVIGHLSYFQKRETPSQSPADHEADSHCG